MGHGSRVNQKSEYAKRIDGAERSQIGSQRSEVGGQASDLPSGWRFRHSSEALACLLTLSKDAGGCFARAARAARTTPLFPAVAN